MITRPIRTLWANDRTAVLRGFALIAAGSLAFNTFFIFMPNHLAAARHLDLVSTLLITAATLGVMAAAALALGRLSDAVGRRPVARWSMPWCEQAVGLLLARLLLVALAGVLLPVVAASPLTQECR